MRTHSCPRIETAGGIRFYPCESVVAVGQIKSSPTSDAELQSALANLESVKELDRSASRRAFDTEFGEAIDHVNNHLHQVFTFLMICGKALNSETMHEKIMNRVLETAPHIWTNIIFALDRYLVTFACDDGVCPNPLHARGVALQQATDSDELLMRSYLYLGQAIEVTRVSGLPLWSYLRSAQSLSTAIFYDTMDFPPRFLSQITIG